MNERFLVVKLADLGDVLTATPALRALRWSFPTARIDALVTPVGATALAGLDSVDRLIPFVKARFDRPGSAGASLHQAIVLGARLRAGSYDRVFLLHHLFTGAGRLKYAALLAAIGATWRGGLAEEKPRFLTECAPDQGYGVKHEVDYWLDVVGLVGARNPAPRLELSIDAAAEAKAERLLDGTPPGALVALYPGAGSYSLARRWSAERYVELGGRLAQELTDARILVLGGADERDLAADVAAGIGSAARSVAGATDLRTLGALLQRCDLFVGNDGGVTHVAAAVGAPIVAIFGPSNHRAWGPYGAREWSAFDTTAMGGDSLVVRTDLPCAPCLYRGFLPGVPRGCPSRDCLHSVEVESVLCAALYQLGKRGGRWADSRRESAHLPPRAPLS